MSYMVEKNRLHNRHFFGEGVVCGLRVDPHPCIESRDKVIVRTGHALNGCGDDILVTRDHELGIISMVRDLIARERGYDCGDPCSKLKLVADDLRDMQRNISELRVQWQTATGDEKEELQSQIEDKRKDLAEKVEGSTPASYGLYVRYKETQASFVTSYQTEPCEKSACQAGRIREGYEFELRCPESPKHRTLIGTIEDCEKVTRDFQELQGKTLHGLSMLEMIQRIVNQYKAIEENLKDSDAREKLINKTNTAAADVLKHPSTDAASTPAPATPIKHSITDQRNAVRSYHKFVTLAFRCQTFEFKPDGEAVTKAITHIEDHIEEFLSKNIERAQSDDDESIPDEVINLIWARTKLVGRVLVDQSELKPGFDARSHAVGELLISKDIKDMFLRLDAINGRLLGLAASARINLSPVLRAEMIGVNLGLFNGDSHVLDGSEIDENDSRGHITKRGTFSEILRQARVVSRAVSEVARICMCNALLPPCPNDDDRAVLLANIIVENCEVREVCNLSRRMVLTGPSLRYWFSEFDGLLNELRKSCSPSIQDVNETIDKEYKDVIKQIKKWKEDSTPLDADGEHDPYVTDIVEARVDQRIIWQQVHVPAKADVDDIHHVDPLERVAVVPTKPSFGLLDRLTTQQQELLKDKNEFDSRSLNVALAALAQRPGTDIRNILAWSEEFSSPTEIRKDSKEASRKAEQALSDVSELVDKIVEVANAVEDETKEGGGRQAAIDALSETLKIDHDGSGTAERKVEEFVAQVADGLRTAIINGELSEFRALRNALRPAFGLDPEDDDDLTRIEGVGPAKEKALTDAGIDSFAKVASMTPKGLVDILANANVGGSRNTSTWPKQAALAAKGKWVELKELQDRIVNDEEQPPPT